VFVVFINVFIVIVMYVVVISFHHVKLLLLLLHLLLLLLLPLTPLTTASSIGSILIVRIVSSITVTSSHSLFVSLAGNFYFTLGFGRNIGFLFLAVISSERKKINKILKSISPTFYDSFYTDFLGFPVFLHPKN
jgi:hypothetical protein